LPEGKFRLIFLGRLSPKKGIENLLETMKLIEDDRTIELTIFGTGDEQYSVGLKNLAQHLGLLNRSVRFLGHVDGEAKRTAFLNADLCVIPSYTESFCMVVAESLGHGVPVIASRGTPWVEVEKHNCGLWVDNDPQALVQAILELRLRDLEEMGRKGWKWMRDKYDWNVKARQMIELYRSL
jgi:glycosyltransferase involved in cell wall biosynthesis